MIMAQNFNKKVKTIEIKSVSKINLLDLKNKIKIAEKNLFLNIHAQLKEEKTKCFKNLIYLKIFIIKK